MYSNILLKTFIKIHFKFFTLVVNEIQELKILEKLFLIL